MSRNVYDPGFGGLHWLIDDGHGWLAVPRRDYPDAVNHGTGYGYVSPDGEWYYLEEDCEATSFLKAHKDDVDWRRIADRRVDWAECRSFNRIPANLTI